MMTAALFLLLLQAPAPRQDLHGDPLPQDAAVRLGRVQFRHDRWIYGMALSADNKTLATGGPDNTIRIWDPATGRLRRVIDVRWVMNLAMTPDGRTVASASSHEKCIRLHDVDSGRELRTLSLDDVASMKISQDGSLIAASGWSKELRIWRVATGELVHDLKELAERATGVAFADGGRQFVAGGLDRELRVWDVATGKELRKIKLDRPVASIASSADSKVVAVSSLTAQDGFLGPGKPEGVEANAILLIDVGTGETIRRIEGHDHIVYALTLSPDGARCAAADATVPPVIRVWDTASGKQTHQLAGHKDRASRLIFTSDGSQLVSTSDDRSIRIWDLATGKEVTPAPKEKESPTFDLAWSPDSQRVATAHEDGLVRLWEARTGKMLSALEGHSKAVHAVAYSPNGSWIAAGGDDRTIRFWNASTGAPGSTLGPVGGRICAIAFDPAGKFIYASGRTFIAKWDVATGAAVFFVPAPDNYSRLSVSPDGKFLAVTEYERRVRILDGADGKEVLSAVRCGGPGVAFLADRPHSLAWMNHPERLVWLESKDSWSTLRRNESPFTFETPDDKDDPVPADARGAGLRGWSVKLKREFRHSDIGGTWQGLDASQDGRWIAVGMFDGSLRLVDMIAGREARQFRWHYYAPYNLRFSPDGTRIASSCASEPYALIWNLFEDIEFNRADADRHWDSLDGSFTALCAFLKGGNEAAAFLSERLKLSNDHAARAERLVAELEGEDLGARDAAQKELREMGVAALFAIHKAMEKGAAGEARVRLERLIEELEGPGITNSVALRRLRAILVLDQQGSPAALRVLESLAKDSPSRRERAEAARALKRPRPK